MDEAPHGWHLGNAPKQSITEVLQNPHGTSLSLPDLPSFDLSHSTTLPPPSRPPPLDINHFEPYLRRYAPPHSTFLAEKRRLDLHAAQPPPPTPVPALYFDPAFSVPTNPNLARIHRTSSPDLCLPVPEIAALRQSLSAQRAQLESDLRKSLTNQSESIRTSLTQARHLRHQLRATASALRDARLKSFQLVPSVVDGLQLTRAVLTVQENAKAIRSAVSLLYEVVKAPDEMAELLRLGEYEGAIAVVGAAKKALGRTELRGVVALGGVRGRLARAVEDIDGALRDVFRGALNEDSADTLAFVVRLVQGMGRLELLQGVFLKEIKMEVAKELVTVESIGTGCKVVKLGAERAVRLVEVIRGRDGENGKGRPDLKDVHGEMEEMLAGVVERLLGSFSQEGDVVGEKRRARPGFVVITTPERLSEQTCFDEFKGGLKFGEELRVLDEMSSELDKIFSVERRGSALKAKISERHIAFISAFHKAHVDELTRTIRGDKWQEIKTPKGALRLLSAVLDDGEEHGGVNGCQETQSEHEENGEQIDGADEALIIDGKAFKTVASGVRYLRSLCAYTLLAEKSPTLAPEVARRGAELSRLFNSLVGQAILGAQSLQWAGLRSITARHLSLASRTIAMAATLADRVNRSLEKALSKSQVGVILPLIHKSERNLREHHGQLLAKILAIMMDRLEAHESLLKSLPWDKAMEMQRFDTPSAYMTNLVKEATVLHRILWSLLPETEVCDIFQRVCAAYGSHLTESYGSLDGGKKWIRSRVAEDVSFLHERLHLLNVFKANPAAIKPISKLYVQFAKEYHEEKEKRDSSEKTSFPGRSFVRRTPEAPAKEKGESSPSGHQGSDAAGKNLSTSTEAQHATLPPQEFVLKNSGNSVASVRQDTAADDEDNTRSLTSQRRENIAKERSKRSSDYTRTSAVMENPSTEVLEQPHLLEKDPREMGHLRSPSAENQQQPSESQDSGASEGTRNDSSVVHLLPEQRAGVQHEHQDGDSYDLNRQVRNATTQKNRGPNPDANGQDSAERRKDETGPSDDKNTSQTKLPDHAFEDEMNKLLGSNASDTLGTTKGVNVRPGGGVDGPPPSLGNDERNINGKQPVEVPEGDLLGLDGPQAS